ncbi:GNAT family N-acetyltransferase [Terrilactibacillus laevilacticus]|uniref:GNAT family N-acetyltransferase n=1 Tax=Terrilactibacillus laevilacticus TaxID=1380157 RepID=A0ABW5PMN6_9BACI
MFVSEEYRGKGIGRGLIQVVFDNAKTQVIREVSPNVDVENLRAYDLYNRMGFKCVFKKVAN